MKPYPYMIHATQPAESTRVLTNNERRAVWAARYFALGLHREPIDDCPQTDEQDTRTRAYALGQLKPVADDAG